MHHHVLEERIDKFLLAAAGLSHHIVVHARQHLAALPVGLIFDRDLLPQVVAFKLRCEAFLFGSGLDAFGLSPVLGQQRWQGDVGEFFSPVKRLVDLLRSGDQPANAISEAIHEQKLVGAVCAAHAGGVERVETAEGRPAGVPVAVDQLLDDGLIVAQNLIAQLEVARLVLVVDCPPGVVVGDRHERAPEGLIAGAFQGLAAGRLVGFQAPEQVGGEQVLVSQIEQIADLVPGIGGNAEIAVGQFRLGAPAADGQLDDYALSHQGHPARGLRADVGRVHAEGAGDLRAGRGDGCIGHGRLLEDSDWHARPMMMVSQRVMRRHAFLVLNR